MVALYCSSSQLVISVKGLINFRLPFSRLARQAGRVYHMPMFYPVTYTNGFGHKRIIFDTLTSTKLQTAGNWQAGATMHEWCDQIRNVVERTPIWRTENNWSRSKCTNLDHINWTSPELGGRMEYRKNASWIRSRNISARPARLNSGWQMEELNASLFVLRSLQPVHNADHQ